MKTVDNAILAIRHVVQDHSDEETRLGEPANLESIRWFGSLLSWEWPTSYLGVLAKHDGVIVQDAILFRFLESIEVFLLFHDPWHRHFGYWPVASDGCGNYFVLSMDKRNQAGECPVLFVESNADEEENATVVAESYEEFVRLQMVKQCERSGCTELVNGK